MTLLFTRAIAFALVAALVFVPVVHAVDAYWIGGPTGNWSDPANWSTGVVPSASNTNVTIDANSVQATTVVLDQGVGIAALTIDPFDTLNVAEGIQASVGAASIAGTLNFGAAVRFVPSEYLWVQPTGRLNLTDTAAQTGSLVQISLAPLWNQGIIDGAGTIATPRSIANEGQIIANSAGQQLFLALTQGPHSNSGTMLATDGGWLRVGSALQTILTPLQNFGPTTQGLIQAQPGSQVTLENVTIQGGEISSTASDDGVHGLVVLSNVALNRVRLEGEITGSRITFQQRVENNATITPSFGGPLISVSSSAELAGNGRIELRNGAIQGPGSTSLPYIFINSATHTISGPGTIGFGTSTFKFINRGLVESVFLSRDSTLQINVGGNAATAAVNAGTIRARDGSTVWLNSSTTPGQVVFENFEGDNRGVIEADLNSTVRLSGNYTLRGGVIRSVAPEEPGPAVAGKVISFGSITSVPLLKDLRLEGTIGDSNSTWRLTGTIDNTGELRGRELNAEGTTILTGGGTIKLEANSVISGNVQGLNYLINEDNLITGQGRIETNSAAGWNFVNRGIVEATIPTSGLQFNGPLSTQSVFNRGLMRATNGSTLSLQGTSVLNREGTLTGTIHADDASLVQLGPLSGGILSTSGTGRIRTGPALADVHNQGSLHVQGTTIMSGTIRNDGTITTQTALLFGGLVQLTGSGSLGQTSSSLNIAIGTTTPALFTHGIAHTIYGHGSIRVQSGLFINEGTIRPEGPGPLIIDLNDGTMMQKGMLHVQGGERLEILTRSETFNNKGTFDIAGEILIDRLSPGSLTVINDSGANISLRGRLHLDVLDNPSNRVALWNQAGATLSGKGIIDLVETGPIQGVLRNSGLIRPEGEFAELGRIYLDGDFQQDSTGTLEMNVAGIEPGEFDALILSGGEALLGGTLDIHPLATFDPPVDQEYTLIDTQGGTVTGAFDTLDAPALSGRWWSLDYFTDKVMLSVEPITADFNLDGLVNEGDLAIWQAALGIDASADADADGDSDGRDLLLWQRQYGSGVAAAGAFSVPEPNAWAALLEVGLILLVFRRQFLLTSSRTVSKM